MKLSLVLGILLLAGCTPQPSVQKRDFCELGRLLRVGPDDQLSRPLAQEVLANNRLYQELCGAHGKS
jgi:hypothetical protein